uniref:Uncharacterized protein n=1 Tax=Arundo donax TaxID=35708 RepID=A0A0A9A9G6_ARUDO
MESLFDEITGVCAHHFRFVTVRFPCNFVGWGLCACLALARIQSLSFCAVGFMFWLSDY